MKNDAIKLSSARDIFNLMDDDGNLRDLPSKIDVDVTEVFSTKNKKISALSASAIREIARTSGTSLTRDGDNYAIDLGNLTGREKRNALMTAAFGIVDSSIAIARNEPPQTKRIMKQTRANIVQAVANELQSRKPVEVETIFPSQTLFLPPNIAIARTGSAGTPVQRMRGVLPSENEIQMLSEKLKVNISTIETNGVTTIALSPRSKNAGTKQAARLLSHLIQQNLKVTSDAIENFLKPQVQLGLNYKEQRHVVFAKQPVFAQKVITTIGERCGGKILKTNDDYIVYANENSSLDLIEHVLKKVAGFYNEKSRVGTNKRQPVLPASTLERYISEGKALFPGAQHAEDEQKRQERVKQDRQDLLLLNSVLSESRFQTSVEKLKNGSSTEEIFDLTGTSMSALAEYVGRPSHEDMLRAFVKSDLKIVPEVIMDDRSQRHGFKLYITKNCPEENILIVKQCLAELASSMAAKRSLVTASSIRTMITAKRQARQIGGGYTARPYAFMPASQAHDFFTGGNRTPQLEVFDEKLSLRIEPAFNKGIKGFNVFLKETAFGADAEVPFITNILKLKQVLSLIEKECEAGRKGDVTTMGIRGWLNRDEAQLTREFAGGAAPVAKAQAPGLKRSAANPDGLAEILIPKRSPKAAKAIALIRKLPFTPLTETQREMRAAPEKNRITFYIAPAGVGKTRVAVDAAIDSVITGRHDKIYITRPAMESGEKLGFLPGSIEDKMDPYLRPIYDETKEVIADGDVAKGKETLEQLMLADVIEIVPLAYIRGRSLKNAFIYLDEAQNTIDIRALKGFMTRLTRSTMVIGGDPGQVDPGVTLYNVDGKPQCAFGVIVGRFERNPVEGIKVVRGTVEDSFVRDPLLPSILRITEGLENLEPMRDPSKAVTPKFNQSADPAIVELLQGIAQTQRLLVEMLAQDETPTAPANGKARERRTEPS